MNRVAVVIAALCSLAFGCFEERDTGTVAVWPRSVQPRLSGAQWRPCEGPECGRKSAEEESCLEILSSQAEALQELASRPHCTDNAIARLQAFAAADPNALSDVAAAYYLRAYRENHLSDLLAALETADRAPESPASRFNLALIQETVGLHDAAIESWKSVARTDKTPWAGEARQHLARLQVPNAAAQWRSNVAPLRTALQRGDRTAVRKLIADFPTPAMDYFEQVVLPQNDSVAANTMAAELSARLKGDRYVLEAAEAMPRAHEGHVAFAARRFADAAPLLRRAGSPLYLIAEIEQALLLRFDSTTSERALALLEPLEAEARKHRYTRVLARLQSTRGYFHQRRGQYLDAMTDYRAALDTFSRLADVEMVASIHRSNNGTYRLMGQREPAFREALLAARALPRIVDARRRHVILGEITEAALALGYRRAALMYQEAAVRNQQNNLLAVPPDRLADIRTAQQQVGIALRARAGIELQLGLIRDATSDLVEAFRLIGKPDSAQSLLQGRTHEFRGQFLLQTNPRGALDEFTAALKIVPGDELRTFRADLFAQRAEAARLARRAGEEARDLESALRELREEEVRLLKERKRGEGEAYWSAYFARTDETYDRLVRHFAQSGQWEEAFHVDERSRAFEPLDLILRLESTPVAFENLVRRGEPMDLGAIRKSLPRGTVLLQYSVLEDATYTWVVSSEGVRHLRQRATAENVRDWSRAIQQSVARRDEKSLQRLLTRVYDELFAQPLEGIPELARLVIVPDGAMHGLPFAALYDSRDKRYLIERTPIEIAGSATLYVYSLLRDRAMQPSRRPSALLIGNPAFTATDFTQGLKPLPHAQTEVAQIGEFYPNAEIRTGADATLAEFLARARNKTIIHFAGHSIVNEHEPWNSMLLFAGNNGAITAAELLKQLDLDQTRLFVLSACSSAGGHPVGPEGVSPLVRPLITAGVPAVMGTLWDVEDATAEPLSVSFHRRYEQGSDAAMALQAAQREMLRNGNRGLRSILAWAPFQVIGHGSSPFESTQKRLDGGTPLGLHRKDSFHRDDGLHPQ